MITVDQALEQNREVMAVPGRADDICSQGCNELIKTGAMVITKPEDIWQCSAAALWKEKNKNNKINKHTNTDIKALNGGNGNKKPVCPTVNLLATEKKLVYSVLCLHPKDTDEIINETGLNVSTVMQTLLLLQLEGYQTVNGVTIGYLSYTEMTNGLPTPSGSEYGVVYLDQRDVIEKQITDMRPNCDVLVVSCHWGVEGSHTVTDAQRETAQWLADQGADLIIGTHPHVTQTAQWLTGTNENKSFVAYSLGNFINAQDMPDNMIGAILDVTFQKTTAADGTVTVEIQNPVLHPVITQYEPHYANIRVYLYKDYTDELGAAHGNFALSRASIEQVLNGSIDSEFLSLE